jgi:hypothetical protein
MRKSKRSQTEILGLSIVIIFLSIGMLFVVKSIISKKPSQERETYIRSELASNILGSIVDVHTDCRNQDLSDLLQDCAEFYPTGSIECPNGKQSCDYADTEIRTILSSFMDRLGGNKSYQFIAITPDAMDIVFIKQGNCTIWESATQPLPTLIGTINLKFNMCK